jgi:hypothetical protein
MSFSVSRPLPLSAMPAVVLLTPEEAHEIDATRAIFRDYAGSLGIDLEFQDFDGELASLPGDGGLLRARLLRRPLDDQPTTQRRGDEAPVRAQGVPRFRAWAGSWPRRRWMPPARRLRLRAAGHAGRHGSGPRAVRGPGFEPIPPYYHNPIAGRALPQGGPGTG